MQIRISGSNFVLTGPMKIGVRSYIIDLIEQCGGFVLKTASHKSNYVVVSMDASRHWLTTHFGIKIKRACELIEEGHQINFVSEVALAQAINIAIGADSV
jgi:NAD-dependent DNA ligase